MKMFGVAVAAVALLAAGCSGGEECARDRDRNHDPVGGLIHANSTTHQHDWCTGVVRFQDSDDNRVHASSWRRRRTPTSAAPARD